MFKTFFKRLASFFYRIYSSLYSQQTLHLDVVEIPLTRGKIALIDKNDSEKVLQYKWRAVTSRGRFYAVRNLKVNGKWTVQSLGRFLLNTSGKVVSINSDLLDCRRTNLLAGTHTNVMQIQKIHKNNRSGYKGVYFDKTRNSFRAQIRVDKIKIAIGDFSDPIDAALVYDAAAKKYFGPFAKLNFPS